MLSNIYIFLVYNSKHHYGVINIIVDRFVGFVDFFLRFRTVTYSVTYMHNLIESHGLDHP